MISIASWNINSIRKKVDKVNEFLTKQNPDILFISETKITLKLEKDLSNKIDSNYNCIWNTNKNSHWHGTCLLYKKDTFDKVNVLSLVVDSHSKLYKTVNEDTKCSKKINSTEEKSIDDDTEKAHKDEGRVILCEFILRSGETMSILGTYSPNSGVDRRNPLKRLAYRTLRWDPDIFKLLEEIKTKYKNVLWIGDLNVAVKDNDMSYKMNIAGTTFEERNNFKKFLENGWIDTFDELNPEKNKIIDRCTYGYNNSVKLRLDYIICSREMKESIKSSDILYGYDDVSDHLPISVVISL